MEPQRVSGSGECTGFIDPKLGRAIPNGIYDIGNNKGWVSVDADHDTASFAVHAIGRWWLTMEKNRYPSASASWLPPMAGAATDTVSDCGK